MNKAIFDAVGEILKEERQLTEKQLTQFRSDLEQLIEKAVSAIELPRGEKGKDGANGVDGIGIKAVELHENRTAFDLIFDNDEKATIELPEPLKGADGRDADPIDVAKALRTDADFVAWTKGEKGDPGEKGDTPAPDVVATELKGDPEFRSAVKGEDGLDRPVVELRKAAAGDKLDKNELVIHQGGIWQSTRKTSGNPTEDPDSYRCAIQGVAEAKYILDEADRRYDLVIRLTDGQEVVKSFQALPGYMPPKEGVKQLPGDFYMEGPVLKIYGEDATWAEYDLTGPVGPVGPRGRKGMRGEAGVGIEEVVVEGNVLYIALTDGTTKELLLDLAVPEQEKVDQEIKRYAGSFRFGNSYKAGDVVSASEGLYLALKDTSSDVRDINAWVLMYTLSTTMGGGGGGGGGGGNWVGNSWIGGTASFSDQVVTGVSDPRSGAIGQTDVVNRGSMEKAIAAGALYQGTWQPVGNIPDLWAETDSGFKWPAAGSEIAKPAGTTHTISATDVGVWFNITPGTWSGFPWQVAAPIPVDVWLSDGEHVSFNINPQTFATQGDFRTALRNHIAGTGIADFVVDVISGELWVSVETTPPIYPVAMTPSIAGGYPDAEPGTDNQVLNTYNWVVQTADPNTPEVTPPGVPGVPAGTVVRNSDILQWSSSLGPLADPMKPASATNMPVGAFEIIRGGQMTQSFSDQRYWQVKGRNFEWRADDYPAGSVVLHNNVWFQATQQIGVADPEPGNIASAAIWRKINTSHGATTFFGAGDWVDYPNLQPANLQEPLTAANNWGMPAGTIPSGQQPEDQDIYYDILSGSRTTFGVTKNPPAYTISGTVDTQNAPVGEMSLGQMAGHENYLNFTNDGSARGAGDYLQLVVPDDFTTAIDAAATATWNNAIDAATSLASEIPSIGNWVNIAGALNTSALSQQYAREWGPALSAGGAILRIASDGVFGVTDQGFRVVDGCIYIPPNVWSGVGGGATFPQTWNTAPAAGHFVNQNLVPGTYYVIWTGDSQADNHGWVLIDNQPPLDWTVNTPNPQQVPDTITAARVWGYRRNFEWTVPTAAVDDDVWGVIVGFPADDNIYHIVLKDEARGGSVYEFEIVTASTVSGRITPISVLASNDHFKEIILGWNGTDHYFISVKTTGNAAGVTYRIEVDTPYPQGIADVHLDTIKRSNVQSKMDATKNYPTDELTNFLQALSGDASKATAVPGRAPGQNVGGATIALEGGKVYRQSGYYLSQSGFTPLVSIYHDKSATNKLLLANADIWSSVILRGDNKTASASPMDNGGDGWFSCLKYSDGVQANKPVYCEVTLDLRDPNKIMFKFEAQGRFAQAGNNVHFRGSTTIIWPVDPAHDPTGYGFYFSGWNGDGGYEWFMFRDS